MPELAPATAFGRTEPRRAQFGSLVLAEDVSTGLASLALPRGAAAPQVEGMQLPEAGGWVDGGAIAAFWTGRSQWMIAARDRALDDFEQLRAALPEAAITEQTHGWVMLQITAAGEPRLIERVLEKLINIDPAWLSPGKATRTAIEHMSVFVIRRSPDVLIVLGMRSMAQSLWHALETAAARLENAAVE